MDLVIVTLAMLIGIAIGYCWRQPEERIRVQYVDVPGPVVVERVMPPVALAQTEARETATVKAVFMDQHERKVKDVTTLDARLRRPTVMRGTQKYVCSRQDAQGRYVYRAVTH